jgi:hypothetical protein
MLVLVACSRPCVAQDAELAESSLVPPFEETIPFLTPESEVSEHLLLIPLTGGGGRGRQGGRLRMEIGPIFRGIGYFLRSQGLAVEEHRKKSNGKTAGISASFRPHENAAPVTFHVGDGSLEPFDAFYGNDGLRWALVWPVSGFTLRFEGGEDSEFGSYGIAGAQWKDWERKFAVGVGFPMRLRNAEGDFGVIVQLRTKIF